jgi:hypothetical protein
MPPEAWVEDSVDGVAAGASSKLEFVGPSTSACVAVVADDRAVVENWETAGGAQVIYVVELAVSNAVPGKLAMPGIPNEETATLDAALLSPKFGVVSVVSAGTTDCDANRSAGAPDVALSGIARVGGLSMTTGEILTGATIARFMEKVEAGAAVLIAGVCSAGPFERGLAPVEFEGEI